MRGLAGLSGAAAAGGDVPLPPRPRRGRDRCRPGLAARHREVPAAPCAGPAPATSWTPRRNAFPHRGGGARWLSTTTTCSRDLVALAPGRGPPAPSPGLATAVLDRVSDAARARRASGAWSAGDGRGPGEPTPPCVGRWWSAPSSLALLATPPVRAAVVDWFGFGGGPGRARRHPVGASRRRRRPRCTRTMSVAEAVRRGRVRRVGPGRARRARRRRGLGRPAARVDELADRAGRRRPAGPVRWPARLLRRSRRRPSVVVRVAVHDGDALWFEEPHEVRAARTGRQPRSATRPRLDRAHAHLAGRRRDACGSSGDLATAHGRWRSPSPRPAAG